MAKKVLVVDDEEGIRRELAFILEDEGYVPMTASSGFEALANLEDQRFDIVITDLMLPDLGGTDAA